MFMDDDDLTSIHARYDQRRPKIRPPKKMADVLSNLMSKRGYGRVIATGNFDDAWQAAIGPRFAGDTRCGNVKRGVLEVLVASSAVLQELTFSKKQILTKLQTSSPDQKITDLKFKVGAIK
jgi:predicted nucleic acid-binding Zn ribbon protein